MALISDTGLRLSEALGLSCGDVCLDTSHPLMLSSNQSHGDGLRQLTVSDWFHRLVRHCGLPREQPPHLTRGTCSLVTAMDRSPKRTQPVLL